MMRRGRRLRTFATGIFDAGTMERIIDPAIADLQLERRPWVGYLTVLKVIVLCGFGGSAPIAASWPDEDRRNLWRIIGMSSIALACVTLIFAAVPLSLGVDRGTFTSSAALLLLPQALTISVPMALTLGIGFSLGGRLVSGRLKLAVVMIATACSIATFANIGWLTPTANQSFRLLNAARVGIDPAAVRPGLPELNFGELRQLVRETQHSDQVSRGETLRLELTYYARWVISYAPFLLAVFMLSMVTGRVLRRWALGLIALVTVFGYYVVMYLTRTLAFAGDLSAPVALWIPNILLATLAIVLMLVPIRRRLKPDATDERQA